MHVEQVFAFGRAFSASVAASMRDMCAFDVNSVLPFLSVMMAMYFIAVFLMVATMKAFQQDQDFQGPLSCNGSKRAARGRESSGCIAAKVRYVCEMVASDLDGFANHAGEIVANGHVRPRRVLGAHDEAVPVHRVRITVCCDEGLVIVCTVN